MEKMKAIAIVSGGLDSVAMSYVLASEGYEIVLISFNYGQRHSKELDYAALCAGHLKSEHHIVDVRALTNLMNTSSLTSNSIEVPDGHYAEETMKQTVVLNRNAIMINIATALAVSKEISVVATGVHGGDHFIYPDCRPKFIDSQLETLKIANDGFIATDFQLLTPFIHKSKADIVSAGELVGVPWNQTWSCYRGGEIHCGSCGTCFERREAFEIAGVYDPTHYASTPTFVDPR